MHIQETHWEEASEFQTPGWIVVASSTNSPMAGGVQTLISSALCDPSQVSSSAVIPGRLLHVRVRVGDTAIDSTNVYRKVYRTSSARLESTEERFGTPFGPSWPLFRGEIYFSSRETSTVLRHSFAVRLATELTATELPPYRTCRILKASFRTDLVRLNSWSRGAGATYRSPQGNTLIDHIDVWRRSADRLSVRVLDLEQLRVYGSRFCAV